MAPLVSSVSELHEDIVDGFWPALQAPLSLSLQGGSRFVVIRAQHLGREAASSPSESQTPLFPDLAFRFPPADPGLGFRVSGLGFRVSLSLLFAASSAEPMAAWLLALLASSGLAGKALFLGFEVLGLRVQASGFIFFETVVSIFYRRLFEFLYGCP